MIDLMRNASELLALLCVAGVVAAMMRWKTAVRRDFLLAFIVFLAGVAMREMVVYRYGVTGWPTDALWWSAVARLVQITGAALFVRAAMREACGEWGWIAVLAVAGAGAVLL